MGVSVSAPDLGSLSSPAVALSVVLPILGLLILLGIWLICKQKKSKGNFVVKELWARGCGGVGDRDCSGERPTGVDVDMTFAAGGRPGQLKMGQPYARDSHGRGSGVSCGEVLSRDKNSQPLKN